MLITGGTGFLGRRLALAFQPNFEVVLAGRNNKQNMLAAQFTGCEVLPMDVVNIESVRDVFTTTCPAVVIHAAATKFVDIAERLPLECLDVNVVGSQNVARVAMERGADLVVGISTDKATPPIRNTYGLSKALMERLFCSLHNKASTQFLCVRYGNVAWSTGSVLPIWKKMHEESGVIKTTGPTMRRFFFTVDEAARLVATAVDHADDFGGKVLSRTMKAAQIRDVLDVWIERKGGSWVPAEGRPGEREDEFLVGELELPYAREIDLEGIAHYAISFNERPDGSLTEVVSSATTERLTREEVRSIIESPPPEESGL
jgi:FlaA1/EpsC-like NDP-sugar epimerase